MARVPLIGRLFWSVVPDMLAWLTCDRVSPFTVPAHHLHRREYLALFGSFVLIFLEAVIRIITLGLRAWSRIDLSGLKADLTQLNPLSDSAIACPGVCSTI